MAEHDWLIKLRDAFGKDSVFTDQQEMLDHAYDWWPVAIKTRSLGRRPWLPDAVLRPQSIAQVRKLMAWANAAKVPVTPWGLGSGVTGAALSTRGGICLDMSLLNRVIMLDEKNLMVRVQAGMNGLELETLLNERGYTLNHSPQSLERSTVGGWIATRATGQFSSRWGGIENLALSLSIVLPGGDLIETPLGPRSSTGPDLVQLFIGSEGTFGVVVDVTLRIFPKAEERRFESLTFVDVTSGLEAMQQVIQSGLRPFLLRFYDVDEAQHVLRSPDYGKCLMLIGFEGPHRVVQAEYDSAMDLCRGSGGCISGPEPAIEWMNRRFDFSTIEKRLRQSGGYAETIEVADFWGNIYETYQILKTELAPHAQQVLGHFSHVYPQGTSLYLIMLGQAMDDASAEKLLLSIWETAMRICLERGAVLSHHHGVGLARLPYINEALGSSMKVLQMVKHALDPNGIMNPGKLGFPVED